MNIKILVLKPGLTLMGEVQEDDHFYVMKKPVHVINVPPRSPNEQPAVGFSPFLEYTEEFNGGFSINKNDVLVHCTPVVELLNQYNQVFGSGIQIASASSIPRA